MADERATNGKAANGKDVDPMAAFHELRDTYLNAWSKTMVDAVNTEAYAKASGQMLDAYLSVSSPFREIMEKTMLQALQQLSMPSRADVISLAERLTNIEMKLDDMDAKLDKLTDFRKQPASAARVRKPAAVAPRNTRKGKR
jgi:hypothetical protein